MSRTRGSALGQVPRRAAEGAAGAETRDEVREPTLRLHPDLGAGGLEVGPPVGGVAVLVHVAERLRIGLDHPARFPDRAVRALHRVRQDEFGAERAEDAAALDRSVLRQAERHADVHRRADHGERDAGVARGRVQDAAAAVELAGVPGRQHHVTRRAVLDRAAGIRHLRLRQEFRSEFPCGRSEDVAQVEQGRVADPRQEPPCAVAEPVRNRRAGQLDGGRGVLAGRRFGDHRADSSGRLRASRGAGTGNC